MRAHPIRVLPNRRALPLLDGAATAGLERRLAADRPPGSLMSRAGEAVARLALALAPHAERIWVAAGPGNNGGDGLAAAIGLRAAGRHVDVSWLGDPERLPPDAARALGRAREAGVPIHPATAPSTLPGLAIDALLGAGASRPAEGRLREAIRALNGLAGPVLAVDLPSGLDPRTGRLLGDDVVRASDTLALLTPKPGLFTGHGRDLAGTIWLDPLDERALPLAGESPTAWLSAAPPPAARRPHARHKGSYGDVVVVGGATDMTGAALLAARAALAAGAGRVHVQWLDRSAALARLDPLRPELMFRDRWLDEADDAAFARTTVVCGCGGGEAVAAELPRLLERARRLVLDADALNAVAGDPALASALGRRSTGRRWTVLTPHPLEAARLLDRSTEAVQRDRLASAAELAGRFRCTVVLKGSGSIVATPGDVPRINATGNAALATAGTGDVLAGWLGGRWASDRSVSEDDGTAAQPAEVVEIACRAVGEHGAAAEPPPPGALRADDLIERLYRR